MNTPPSFRLQRTQSIHAGRRLSFSGRSDPPEAPECDSDFSQNDYAIANFEDMNDDDDIYVRWSVAHQRAYMYSRLDRPTQWVQDHWTLRKTIEVGLGYSWSGDEAFDIRDMPSNFVIIHREMLDADGEVTMERLDPDTPNDAARINEILDSPMSCPAPNKIMYMFSVR